MVHFFRNTTFLFVKLLYRVSHKYLNDFLKMGVTSKWVKPSLQMLFKHNYGKLFWKFGVHSFNFSFVHGLSWSRVLESIHRYDIIFTFWKKNQRVIEKPWLMSKDILYWLLKVFAWIFYCNWIFFYLKSPSDL